MVGFGFNFPSCQILLLLHNIFINNQLNNQLNIIDGVRWSPPESAGVLESVGQVHWKKSGQNLQTPADYAVFRRTPPDSFWTKHVKLALVTQTKSRS
jgi:hypothetical protein